MSEQMSEHERALWEIATGQAVGVTTDDLVGIQREVARKALGSKWLDYMNRDTQKTGARFELRLVKP